jgi:hypothetical protein
VWLEKRDLSLELEDTAVNDGLIHQHSCVVDEETGSKVVAAVYNQIIFRKNFFDVISSEPEVIRCDIDVWV